MRSADCRLFRALYLNYPQRRQGHDVRLSSAGSEHCGYRLWMDKGQAESQADGPALRDGQKTGKVGRIEKQFTQFYGEFEEGGSVAVLDRKSVV